jgi:hypothetical protein
MTLWAAKVQVTDSAANTTTAFNWTSASITAVGYAGSNGGTGPQGASYVTAYCASATATTTTAPAQTTGKGTVPATNDGGISGTWSSTVPTLTSGQYLYQSDGIYDPTTNKVTWSIPYWSSLKVGSLSAISANLGAVTAGSININNGVASIDANGNAAFKALTITDASGNVILSSGNTGSLPTAVSNAATTATWSSVTGTGKPADNATVGATIGTNLSGQITSSNSSSLIANQALLYAQISDVRTGNYAEDGAGNATAGAKMSSIGTALKVANNSFQVGSLTFSDYWYRLIQGIDGNIANGRVIWRGNNDSTTRGGAPNIACLSVTPWVTSFSGTASAGAQTAAHAYKLTPTSYSGNTDNLDAIQQIHVQFFINPSATAPFTELYMPCPSRTYDGASGIVQGNWQWSWPYFQTNTPPQPSAPMRSSADSSAVYTGVLRVRIANTYGWSDTQDFAAGVNSTTPLAPTTITGSPPPPYTGGSGSQGGSCPAPWVKVRLLNGTEVNASDLHNGARLTAVNDSTMQPLPQGGVVRNLATIWAQRYRVKLTNGECTEWSENHRFAVADRGWVQVQNLRGGDQILGMKECVVESVLAVGEGQVVSFQVEGAGTYFAGGLLCHNTKVIS